MVDGNWLPAPGAAVTVIGLVLMAVALVGHGRTLWAESVFRGGSALTVGGLLSMIGGIVLGVSLTGWS